MDVDEIHARDPGPASEKIRHFVQAFIERCGMDLTYELGTGEVSGRDRITVVFAGSDTPFLIARNAELLHGLESLAVDLLRLSPEDHELVSFDAEGFKAARARRVQRSAQIAVSSVTETGRPYAFPPMNSRERRMLHLELVSSGLRTESSGEAPRRFVILYPPEQKTEQAAQSTGSREKVIRNAFRPR